MHIDTNSHRLKVNQNIFALGMVKNGCGQSGHRTLKLTRSREWIDRMKWFFHAGADWGKLKVISLISGWVSEIGVTS